jgi:hypothetical protein
MYRKYKYIFACGLVSILSCGKAIGDLAEDSMNPLGTVISLPFENNTLFNLGPSNSTANVLNIKPIFPVDVGNWNLINRVIVPVVYAQGQDDIVDDDFSWGNGNPGSFGIGSAFGLGDTTYQGFITPKKSGKVAWGLGGSIVVPTHTKVRFGSDKWSAGPALVAFAPINNWVLGGILQNIWSVAGDSDAADINVFSAQLTVNYKLKNRWYLTTSPLITANWEAPKDNRWTVPLGGGIGRVFKMEKKAIAVDVGAYYNVESPRFANDWYSQILVNFLFPK